MRGMQVTEPSSEQLDNWLNTHNIASNIPDWLITAENSPPRSPDIEIGRRSPAVPLTPPCVRVRAGGFGEWSYDSDRQSNEESRASAQGNAAGGAVGRAARDHEGAPPFARRERDPRPV